MEAVHEGITAGNEKYAYYTSKLSANSILKIKFDFELILNKIY